MTEYPFFDILTSVMLTSVIMAFLRFSVSRYHDGVPCATNLPRNYTDSSILTGGLKKASGFQGDRRKENFLRID